MNIRTRIVALLICALVFLVLGCNLVGCNQIYKFDQKLSSDIGYNSAQADRYVHDYYPPGQHPGYGPNLRFEFRLKSDVPSRHRFYRDKEKWYNKHISPKF